MHICHATLRASQIPIVCSDTETLSTVRCPCPIPLPRFRCRSCIRYVLVRILVTMVLVQNATSTVCSQDSWSGRFSDRFPPTPSGSSDGHSGVPGVFLSLPPQWHCS